MKKSRFTDSQIAEAFKRVEAGLAVPELCREMGISSATFYKWRAKYGGMDTSMMARLKELEVENARLKKMYAEERLKSETSPPDGCGTTITIAETWPWAESHQNSG